MAFLHGGNPFLARCLCLLLADEQAPTNFVGVNGCQGMLPSPDQLIVSPGDFDPR